MKQKTSHGAQQALAKAFELRQRGDLEGAEKTLRQLLRADPRVSPAFHLLGLVRFQRGDLKEAQELVERAVKLAPNDVDAWRNLGNICVDRGSPERAEECFRVVLRLHPQDVAARGQMALILEESGRVEEAIGELRILLRMAPNELDAMRILARLLRQTKQHGEEVIVARELMRRCPHDPALKPALARSYFLWFDSVDRDKDKALSVLKEWLTFDPSDPIAQHMMAALSGDNAPPRASDQYVERHFDEFAATFDDVLDSLGYCGPKLIEDAIRAVDPEPRGAYVVADLGCGTGKSVPIVRPWARTLIGVDLSSKMLELAQRRGGYDELVHAELSVFLAGRTAALDLAICADTLIYFGELTQLFKKIAGALRPGGRFFATAELLESESTPYRLFEGGRYTHSRGYLTKTLEEAGLVVEQIASGRLRVEYGNPVNALVMTARRPQ